MAAFALANRPLVAVLLFLADLQAPGQGSLSNTTVPEPGLRRPAADAAAGGEFAPADLDLVEGSFSLGDTPVAAITAPRPNVAAIPLDTLLEAALAGALRSGHRRLPVHRGSLKTISGVVRVARPCGRRLGRLVLHAGRTAAVGADRGRDPQGPRRAAQLQAGGHPPAVAVDEAGGSRADPVRSLGPGRGEVDASADVPVLEETLGASRPEGRQRTVARLVEPG
ncbi:MAG: hypothetical protein ABIJ48_09875 [Actinomycetota bacterium]